MFLSVSIELQKTSQRNTFVQQLVRVFRHFSSKHRNQRLSIAARQLYHFYNQ